MDYALDYGSIEAQILKDCRMSGMPIPERIAKRPELNPGLELYLEAFYALSADRPSGMQVGRIPWTAQMTYARFFGFDEQQTEFLFYIVPKLDTITLERKNAQSK